MLWRIHRVPVVLNLEEFFQPEAAEPMQFETTFERDRKEFLRVGYRRIWRTLGERFHDPEMNGLDWEVIRVKYEGLASRSRTSREFDHVIGRLMGELNASHLVFQRKPWSDESKPKKLKAKTLHPGLVFTPPADGPLRVAQTLPGFPIHRLKPPIFPDEVVLSIGGKPVDGRTPLSPFFLGLPGKVVVMTLKDQKGNSRVVSAKCDSYEMARLVEKQTSLANNERTSRLEGVTYLPLRSMSSSSLEKFRLAIHRASIESKALILDLRANGGGREANRMLASLLQEIPFITQPRGGPIGYSHDRLPVVPWQHPVAVLCDQNTYSNSEIFCHAYLAADRGPLIGTRTAGGVISAVKTDIMGLGKLQVPFRSWRDPRTKTSLDLNGAQPSFPVPLTPADEVAGRDPQLEKALEVLSAENSQ